MKKITFLSALMIFLAAGLRADDGCDKSADACGPRIKKVTPFMAELKKTQTAPALRQGAVKELSIKQAGPNAQIVAAPPADAAAPAPKAPAEDNRTVSHPAWLLAAGALLAGLYYFLRENKKKGKRG